MSYNPKWLENSTDVSLGGYDGASGSDDLVPTQKAVRSYIDDINTDVQEPTGFPSRTDNTITMGVDGTDVFTIEPTGDSFDYFIKGQRYQVTSKDSLTLTDVEGAHYIYYDATGTLTETTTFNISLIYSLGYVAVVYWDATNKQHIFFGDERHGPTMSGPTHANIHLSRGTLYVSGLALGDIIADSTSAADADAQISVTSGTIYGEDLQFTISAQSAPAQVPMFYQDASGNWRRETADDYPLINTGSGRMAWNESGVGLSEATDGYFVLSHIFATNSEESGQEIIGVVGNSEYSTISAARDGAETEINTLVNNGLPFAEFVALGTVIFETSSSFANTPKSIIRSTNSGGDYQDWRLSSITPVVGSASNHSNLSGLANDDHLQYARIDGARAFTGSQEFSSGIDVSGGTFQLATGTTVNELSTDGTLVGNSDDVLVTEKAIKTYVDTEISGLDFTRIYEGNTEVHVQDAGAGTVTINVDGGEVGLWNASGLKIGGAGATIDEFSTDGNLSGDSDTAVPTEKAVKTYVDAQVGGAVNHNSTTGLQGGDSTSSEYYHLVADIYNQIYSTSSDVLGIGSDSGTNVVTDQANDRITADANQTRVLSMTDSTQRMGVLGTSTVVLDSTSVTVSVSTFDTTFSDGSVTIGSIATFDTDGLTLASGASINEFSTDTTLAGDSDDAVPTEKAVKTYVDNSVSGLFTNKIWQDDSYVQVTDDGTATGSIEIVSDGVQVAYFDADSTTQRIGKAASSYNC
jgi:hypothetical protein